MPFEIAANKERGLFGVVANTSREAINAFRKDVPISILSPDGSQIGLPSGNDNNEDTLEQTVSLAIEQVTDFLSGLPSQENSSISQSRFSYSSSLEAQEAYNQKLKEFSDSFDSIDFEHCMAAAFLTGNSYQAFYNLGGDYNGPGPRLDNHSDYGKFHLQNSKWYMDKIAAIFNLFKTTEYSLIPGTSLFDHTTFVVTNEFSRPPGLDYQLNGQMLSESSVGKGHNPNTNSVLIAGKNVVGNKVIGRSQLLTTYMKSAYGISNSQRLGFGSSIVGLPFDYTSELSLNLTPEVATEAAAAPDTAISYKIIKPENVVATIRSIMGIDPGLYLKIDMNTPFIKSLVKN